jgi:hypothetical protein
MGVSETVTGGGWVVVVVAAESLGGGESGDGCLTSAAAELSGAATGCEAGAGAGAGTGAGAGAGAGGETAGAAFMSDRSSTSSSLGFSNAWNWMRKCTLPEHTHNPLKK